MLQMVDRVAPSGSTVLSWAGCTGTPVANVQHGRRPGSGGYYHLQGLGIPVEPQLDGSSGPRRWEVIGALILEHGLHHIAVGVQSLLGFRRLLVALAHVDNVDRGSNRKGSGPGPATRSGRFPASPAGPLLEHALQAVSERPPVGVERPDLLRLRCHVFHLGPLVNGVRKRHSLRHPRDR